ncbi:MAG: MarR family transcriptional regulator [Clostridiales bacterium]|uniref:MarR family winged helix-turn-helix transcriptional regulator n=1 Tax=Flavonifractor porci TaxID=3133422 RepID=UPI003099C57D|nr:MarR family transcriptional regulator [Clostridiales bacterium]
MKSHGFRAIIDHLSRVQRASDNVLRNYGIDIPLKTDEIHLLDLIDKHPDCNLTTLAEMMWASKMVISGLVRRLEEKGLLTITQGRNKKERICHLTERAKIAVDTHDAYHRMEQVFLSERMEQYTDEEIALVERVLEDYAKYLEEYAKDATIL